MRKALIPVACVLYLLQSGTTARAQVATNLKPPPGPVTATYFGMHNHEPLNPLRRVSIDIGTYRLWDADVNWPNLEPTRGKWVFTRLDAIIALAEQRNWQVILPFAFSPAWASARPTEDAFHTPARLGWSAEPRDLNDWRDYIQTVATRYKGRVHYYEIWNEPNNSDNFTGTIPQLVTLAKEASSIVKSIDPGARIVSPPVAYNSGDGLKYLDSLFAAGIGEYADVIGYHFYIDDEPPERLPVHIAEVRQVMANHGAGEKPLWNTEACWATVWIRFPSAAKQAAWVARSYILNWAAGVEQYDWYAWDNRVYPSIYMLEADLHTPTVAADAYVETRKWLMGSRMTSVSQDQSGFWNATLVRPDGTFAYVVWNPAGTAKFTIPSSWHSIRVRDLAGETELLSSSQFSIGESPVLFETDTLAVAINDARAISAASGSRGAVARGSLVSIFATALDAGPESRNYTPLFQTLGDATVFIQDTSDTGQLAPLAYAGPGQVNFAVPGNTPTGPTVITVIGRGTTAFRATLDVANVVPGIFTANANGSGPLAGYVILNNPGGAQTLQYTFHCTGAPGTCEDASIPASNSSRTSTLVLFATGMAKADLLQIRATLCRQTLPVTIGPANSLPGVEQLTLRLPESFAGCGPTTLTISAQDAISNVVTLDIQ